MTKKNRVHRSTVKNNAYSNPRVLEFATIRLSEYPLKVEIVEPQKENKRASSSWLRRNLPWCILIPIIVIIGIILGIWMQHTLPQESMPPVSLDGDLKDICIGYKTPSYVFMESKHNIDVTVFNNSNDPFNGTVILAFSQVSLLSIAGNGKTSFKLTDLPAQAQVTRRIGFMLNDSSPGEVLEFQLKVQTPGNHSSGTTGWQSLQVVRNSLLKYIKNFIIPLISFFIGIIGTLLIDIVKHIFFNK